MNNKLLQTLNSTLERTKTTHYAPVTIDALQARLSEELDWLDACPGRECFILLLQELAANMRSARIMVSPGYSFLLDSYLLFLTGVTRVNSVGWDLPFSRGATDGAIFFESDKMREWLFDFDPESMSDLVLLNAIYYPGRIELFPEILLRKQSSDYGKEYRDTYGVPVYQEQTGDPNLAPKGHFIGRTMMAVEALWPYRNKTKLK